MTHELRYLEWTKLSRNTKHNLDPKQYFEFHMIKYH